MICHLCHNPILASQWAEEHHPDRADRERTVWVHATCHTKYHSKRGDFSRWGKQGYERTLSVCPEFHSLGGQARASGARRNVLGQFK